MAICYECGEKFYGNYCNNCEWYAEYNCWNCESIVTPKNNIHHKKCGWYICDSCGECGCNSERPESNEEIENNY